MNLESPNNDVFSLLICRTCLQNGDDLTSICDSKAAEMLRDGNFCIVSKDDGLPNKICSTCLQILEQCYTFKQLCRRSETTLRSMLERNSASNDENSIEMCVFSNREKNENSLDACDDLMRDSFSLPKVDTSASKCEKSLKDDLISFLDKPLPPPLPYQCQQCDHSYKEKSDLQIHQSIHNPDLTCLACSKKFTGRQTLKRHLKIHFIQKPHICKICDKSFPESYALVKHLRYHSGIPREKKHFCEHCGQGFSEPYYLKVHKRKHTGERPLVCQDCQKSFADPRSLKTHLMIHSGDRPYKCSFCSKGFIQNANLIKHLRVHTGEKPYLCKICDKKFSQSSSLDKHLKVHKTEKKS